MSFYVCSHLLKHTHTNKQTNNTTRFPWIVLCACAFLIVVVDLVVKTLGARHIDNEIETTREQDIFLLVFVFSKTDAISREVRRLRLLDNWLKKETNNNNYNIPRENKSQILAQQLFDSSNLLYLIVGCGCHVFHGYILYYFPNHLDTKIYW